MSGEFGIRQRAEISILRPISHFRVYFSLALLICLLGLSRSLFFSVTMWMWMSDVRSGSCLLCPLLQGPCVGPLRSETNFLRRTPSTWPTGTNTLISPGSRQPCWRSSCHSFKRALARASSGVTWLLPSRSTQGVKPSDGGVPPICRPYEVSSRPGPTAAVCVRS